ncbi:MAG TPA: NAD(P)-dependent oxidoreductase [Verrucomicrobiae bacterium]|nr:NAD(P)-dependent oxidoreductase [Verrucomicrobiae bacterium]
MIIAVEDDPWMRLFQLILDPSTPPARTAAFAHFLAHELPDLSGWLERRRKEIGALYPAEVRLVKEEADFAKNLAGATAAAVESFAVGEKEIAAAGGALKILQKYGAVTTSIDRAACERAGVRVLTIKRRANIATAEHAFALLLALARKIHETAGRITVERLRAAGYEPTTFDRAHTANGNWGRVLGTRTLYGTQMGIVGLGEIGREMALRAAAFGMRVVYTQRHRLNPEDEARYHASYAALDDLLAGSDVVSLHLPDTVKTRGIIGRHELNLIKPGALLINVSQPQLIDRAALRDALAAGKVGGFGLDVPYEEPGRADDPLLAFPNVVITPHLGASPRDNSLDDFVEMMTNLARALGAV